MFYIVDPKRDAGMDHILHRTRLVWQWFHDSSNQPWKTEAGARRALEKLKKKYPNDFACAYVWQQPVE